MRISENSQRSAQIYLMYSMRGAIVSTFDITDEVT